MLIVLFAMPWGALANSESEPNDTFSTADPWPQEHNPDTSLYYVALNGTCVASKDYFRFQPIPNRGYRLDYRLTDTTGAPRNSTVEVLDASGFAFRSVWATGSGSINFTPLTGSNHAVGILCDDTARVWALNLTYMGDPVSAQGPSEHEHNDLASMSSSMTGANASGSLHAVYDAVDIWALPAGTTEAEVNITVAGGLAAHLAVVSPQGEVITAAADRLTIRNIRPGGASGKFAVVAESNAGTYTIGVGPAIPSYAAIAGADELELNNDAGNATHITVSDGILVHGESNLSNDAMDWYSITFPYPTRANITVSSSWGCAPGSCEHLELLVTPTTHMIDPLGDPVLWKTNITLAAQQGSQFLLRVDAGYPGGAYEVRIGAPAYPFSAGAVVDVIDGNASGTFSAFGISNGTDLPLHQVNFGLGGYGTMYGPCMKLYILNRAPVAITAQLRAGTLWRASESDLESYITTRTQSFDLQPWSLTLVPFIAAKVSDAGDVPDAGFLYFLDGRATGPRANITNQTASGGYLEQSEITALWAANGVGSADLRQWGASQVSIDDAKNILTAANVTTSINPASHPPPASSTSSSSPGTSSFVGPVVAALVVLVLVGGVVARSRARARRAAAPFPPTPGPWAPGAYPPAYPGAGPTRPMYGGAPPPPGSPWYPVAPGPMPPAPPRAPPAGPPQSPAGGAASTLATARVASAPPPPAEAPQLVPCPTCGQGVQAYAPSCPACGLALQW